LNFILPAKESKDYDYYIYYFKYPRSSGDSIYYDADPMPSPKDVGFYAVPDTDDTDVKSQTSTGTVGTVYELKDSPPALGAPALGADAVPVYANKPEADPTVSGAYMHLARPRAAGAAPAAAAARGNRK
jgi:hypothetical protein